VRNVLFGVRVETAGDVKLGMPRSIKTHLAGCQRLMPAILVT
jgi:hypothetical protein